MSEKLKILSRTERTEKLRQHLLDQSTGLGNKKEWTAVETAKGIANGMPWIYGFLKVPSTKSLRSDSTRALTRAAIENYAHNLGFDSLAELKTSLDEIRDQLKILLPEESWQTYFEDTEDIEIM